VSADSKEGWIAVGRLFRVRGIRGELTGEIYSSQPGRADRLKDVVLQTVTGKRPSRVEEIWFHSGRPVFKFEGIDSISEAEPWEGADVLVTEAERALPEEGAYSHADLIGCKLVDAGNGVIVGVVKSVEEYGGPPMLKLDAEDGRELLIPFVRAICREIDVGSKTIRAQLPEGLLDFQ
jgi:16S rRNA processing protein RimM